MSWGNYYDLSLFINGTIIVRILQTSLTRARIFQQSLHKGDNVR